MITEDDRNTKKIEVIITHQEMIVEDGNTVLIYNISLRKDSRVWNEPATSKGHLQTIIKGINMALAMMGVFGGIPTDISTPFSMKIICYKGNVCRDFK